MSRPERHVFICRHSRPNSHRRGSCGANGSESVVMALAKALARRGWHDKVMITTCSCFGPCEMGPNLVVYPDGVLYSHVQPDDIEELFESHFENGKPVERLMAPAGAW